jgi:hypothetical protein
MQDTDWAVLPDRVREVLAWADASEPSGRVGSRGLLIGVMLAHGRNNEADQLLRHFAVSRREFFERLQAVREVKIDPDVREPSQLTAPPELTPNANEVMKKARELAPGGKPDVEHVFGGILQTSESRAYQALASALPARFSEVVATYADYLRGADRRYVAFLQEQFPRVGNVGGAAADRGTEDQLGFALYVEAFADLIESPETVLPLTIGIYGVWGTGKSFLLNAIGERLEKRSELRRQHERDRKKTNHGHAPPREVPSNVHVVTFNAWEYSANEVIWPGLVRQIMSSLEKRQRFYVRWWWRLRRNLGRQIRVERGRIIGGGAVLLAAALLALLQSRFVPGVLLASIAALGVGGAAKLAFDALGDPLGQWFGALFEDRRYGAPIGYMEEIRHDLDGLQQQRRLGAARVLVIVDDLDRCEPDKAVEVLQAINLLLGFDTFIVCLGIDARVVTQAIDRHYKDLLAAAGASGYEYLDKIVQIPFRIPVPTTDDIKAFLEKQLPRPPTDDPPPLPPGGTGGGPGSTDGRSRSGGEKLPDPPDGVPAFVARFTDPELDAFTRLTPFLRRNPRHLKRLVNVYSLVRSLAKATGATCAENPAATVRWLAIAAQWPYAASRMLRRFSEIDDSRPKPFDGPDEVVAGTDPLLYLYGAVAPSLSEKQRTKYDGDTAQLDALLKSGEDQLLWTDLRDLRYFTVNFNPAVEQDLDDDQAPARAEVKRGADAEEESDNGDRELRARTTT